MSSKPSPEFIAKVRAALLPKAARAQSPAERARRQAAERWEARQRNLTQLARQQAIDAVWERTLQERVAAEASATERSFHKAPGDPDWRLR